MSIRMQADDFFNAYQVLNDNNEALVDKLEDLAGKPLVGTRELGTRPTGGVNIVCLAFSLELYFKDLHFALKGEAPRGHNILVLFKKLPENIRQEILDYDSISQNLFISRGTIFSPKKFDNDYSAYDGFIDHVKAISDSFEKWRYSYESTTLKYDIWFALALIESVKSVADTIRRKS
jgi:HEPN domain-containing protein